MTILKKYLLIIDHYFKLSYSSFFIFHFNKDFFESFEIVKGN